MGDALASALISTIMTDSNTRALKELGCLAGLQTELDNLFRTFTTILAVLCDAEVKQWNSGSEGEAVKTWLRQLKDAAYDADDVLDEFDIKVQRRQQQRGLKNHVRSSFSLHHNPIAFRVEMARKLKSAREKLDVIYQTRPHGLDVGFISSLQPMLEWRLTTFDSFVYDSEIFGRDYQKSELINDLVSSSEALSVHALCGIGGLGKTTLAQLVFNAETIKTHFDLRMWVCVSDDTDMGLTRAIIESIGGDTDSNERRLDFLYSLPRFSEKLGGKKFLLVLDDVWEDFPDKWDRLKNLIRSGAPGSVVLITTRIQQVAEKMATVPIRPLGRLSENDSWSLFARHAFRMGKEEEHVTLIAIGKCIVEKCGGVPLVLRVLGSLLQVKKQEKEWLNVMQSEHWDLADEGEKILATMRLSYTHLPINLKQCFSYCCLYPKDYMMEKGELIQIWMANGFISCGEHKDLHERGQEIFSELVARSFFQNVEVDYLGNITCKMHDLLHDLATSVMEHEFHLIQPGGSLDGAKNYRHVLCYVEVEQFGTLMKGNSKIPSLRSFFYMPEIRDWYKNNGKYVVEWLSSQKYLRILRLGCLNKLPMSLSKHLRYLDVSRSLIKRLPESISSLHKLQTLNLRFCRRLEQLPKGMKNMKRLVYLDIRGCNCLKSMPPRMGQLKGLRKLSKFTVGKKDGCKIGELNELNGLEGELRISGLCNVKSVVDFKSADLMGKKMLTSLELIAATIFEENSHIDVEGLSALQPHRNLRNLLIWGYGSLELPGWMMDLDVYLPNLVRIKLTEFSQCQQLIIPLGRLDFLKVLELSGMFCLEHIGVEVYGDGEKAAFPSLEKLSLYRMRSLKEWAEITTSASSSRDAFPFPCLRELRIFECPLLTKFPIIPSVQDLFISGSTITTSQLTVPIQANFIGLRSPSLENFDQLDEMAVEVSATASPRFGHSEEEAEISNNAPSSAGTEGKTATATATSRGAKGYVIIAADTKGESEMNPLSGTDIGDKDTSQTQGRSSSPESKGHSASPKIEGHPMSVEPKLKVEISVHHMVHKILQFLGDDKTRTIGLYGQGGIGKTFILKALAKVLEADPQFDIIIWAHLSRNWSTRNIQNAVLRQLALGQAHLETDEVIAKRLFQDLGKKKFLLIVDDVWERIDFNRVGIPVDKGKLIVSTTSSDVCLDMAANVVIEVDALTKEDSWELFREQVGEVVDDPIVRSCAQRIVDDCGGLPLLIVATGKALADESSVDVWSHMLKEFILLKPIDGHEALLQKLKISYQRLKVHGRKSPRLRDCDIQTCFLYCALFQEDYREINISELVNYWFQEGLIGVILKDALEKGHDVIEVLTSRALIERTENGSGIKMHEVMRDLASGILSEVANDCQFLVRASGNVDVGQSDSPPRSIGSEKSLKLPSPEIHRCLFKAAAELTKPPPEREWEPANLIFLMDNKLSSLPEKPNCPQLSNLFLQRNPALRKIPMSFFEQMPYLKVLNLSKTSINSIPKSISKLASLQCLNLRGCIRLFKLPPEVGELNHLQLLLLFGTFINQLPEQIGKLSSLKELEVSFYGPVDCSEYSMLPRELIPPGVIAKLLSLKNLSIDVQPGDLRWKKMSSSVMKEMFNLDNLTGLSFYAPEGNDLQLHLLESLLWKEERLRKFNFVVGHDVKRLLVRVPQEVELKYNQQDRCLRFVNAKTVPEEIKAVLTRTTAFYLDHNLEVRSLSEFGVENINGLKFCILRECPEIETIVDGEEGALPWLEHLSIHYLEKLEMIWKNPVPSGSFGNLRYLQVSTCLRLNFVMTRSTSFCLHSLVEIVVEDCQAIKEIIHEDSSVEPEIVVLPMLERLTLRHLPNLVSICKWPASPSSLRRLEIWFCPELITLSDDGLRHLTALQELHLYAFPKMTSLPESIQHLTALVTLNIIDCPDLERRCERDKGEDWPKIVHIPSIRINGKQTNMDSDCNMTRSLRSRSVSMGETSSSISKHYRVSVHSIAAANENISDAADLVFEAQLLNIPASASADTKAVTKDGLLSFDEQQRTQVHQKPYMMLTKHRFPHAKSSGYFIVLLLLVAFCVRCVTGALRARVRKELGRQVSDEPKRRMRWRNVLRDTEEKDDLDLE